MARVRVEFTVKDHKGKISTVKDIVETYRALPTADEVKEAVHQYILDNLNTRDLRSSFVSLNNYTIMFKER
jgi:hypothetical protein